MRELKLRKSSWLCSPENKRKKHWWDVVGQTGVDYFITNSSLSLLPLLPGQEGGGEGQSSVGCSDATQEISMVAPIKIKFHLALLSLRLLSSFTCPVFIKQLALLASLEKFLDLLDIQINLSRETRRDGFSCTGVTCSLIITDSRVVTKNTTMGPNNNTIDVTQQNDTIVQILT